MPQLPLINRDKAAYILNTDILEIQRQLPNGDMLAMKTSVVSLGGGFCTEYQIYLEGGRQNASEALNKFLDFIPRLPTKTCYGELKSICNTTWIDSSYSLDLSVLEETSSDTLAQYVAHYTDLINIDVSGAPKEMRDRLVNNNQNYAKTLIEMKNLLEAMINENFNLTSFYDKLKPIVYDTSCIKKWETSAQALLDAFTVQIAEVEEKVQAMNALEPTP